MLTIIIIITTALVSIASFNNRSTFSKLQFNPYQVYYRKDFYRLVSHGFVHANWTHLIFNMISLFFFGPVVESFFNSNLLFIVFYLSGIIIASLTTLFKHKNNHWYNSVGASGAISAVIFASILIRPFESIMIIPIPIPIPAIVYGVIFLIYSQYMSKRNTDNINHDAHFLGAVYGIIFPIIINPELLRSFLGKIFNIL